MDSGGYKIIYDAGVYLIADETDYFAVYKNFRQIAAFKTKELAFDYVCMIRKIP